MNGSAGWLNDWKGLNTRALEELFGLPAGDLADITVLLASYSKSAESGYAFILFYGSDNTLYEVNASHDSEQDFNGQWEPEETSPEVLQFRLQRGRLGLSDQAEDLFATELGNLLRRIAH